MSGTPDDILRSARRHFGVADRQPLGTPPKVTAADVAAHAKIIGLEPRSALFGAGRELEHQLSEEIAQVGQEISRLEGVKANLELRRREAERVRLGTPPEPGDGWA